jgi:hypothetical protein
MREKVTDVLILILLVEGIIGLTLLIIFTLYRMLIPA